MHSAGSAFRRYISARWRWMMQQAIGNVASYFNSQR